MRDDEREFPAPMRDSQNAQREKSMKHEVIGCPDCGAPAHANVCEATRSRDALIKRLEAENERLLALLADAAIRLDIYSEWCSREIVASRWTVTVRDIKDGAKQDANYIRAALAATIGP